MGTTTGSAAGPSDGSYEKNLVWNYVHRVVCESLYEAFHRDPPLI